MNDIINKFLLAGDKFMPGMNLKQPGFSYTAVDHLQKIKKEYKSGNSRYIYKNELDKACFQEDMAYGDFKAFNIAKDRKYDTYQLELASMVYKMFDKKSYR